MLISITESCHMGCIHCMDDAVPCNKHMDMRTFKDAISFFNQYGGIECIITGGEPTENPNWIQMVKYAIENAHGSTGTSVAHITLTTNGMNLSNNRDYRTWLLSLMVKSHGKLSIQVTHVDKYYPQDVDLSDPFFGCTTVCTEIEAMYPMGRARTNNLPWQSKCSKCFNIRSAVRNTKRLDKACLLLNMHGKFCTPQVDIYGNIKLGESNLCPVVSSIYNETDKIIDDICNFTCRQCDIVNKQLPDSYLEAIGEKREYM